MIFVQKGEILRHPDSSKIYHFSLSQTPSEGIVTMYFFLCAAQIYFNHFKKAERAPRRTSLYELIIIGIMTNPVRHDIRILCLYLL